jgi:hypothetical protein
MFDPNNPFRKADSLVDAVRAVLSGKPVEEKKAEETPELETQEEAMDAVNPKAVKKKFKDRKDKDIDNDGDVDSSDEYLHKRRQAVSKAMKKENDDMDDDDEDDDMEGEKDTDTEKAKKKEKKKPEGKKDDIDLEPEIDDNKMVAEKEMTDTQMKKREEIVKSMKKEMPRFKKKYGDRAKDVMYATATKMAMKEGFELTEEDFAELDEAKQKPYVSSDRDGKHVMNASGKIVKTFKDMDSANAYLKKNYNKLMKEEVELDEVTVANAAKAFDIKKQAVALKAKIAKLKKTPGDAAHMKMIDAKRSFDKKIAALQALDVDAYEIKKLKESSLDVELGEGRGRPSKSGAAGGDLENIQMQLRKSISLRGAKDVEFEDGKKVKVPEKVARTVLAAIDKMRQPKDKQNVVNYIMKSQKNLMDFAAGKVKMDDMDPEAKRKKLLGLK